MANQDDENDFSDGDLDALPHSTIYQLESNALSSTQSHVAALRNKNYNQVTRPYKLSVPQRPTSQQIPNPPSSDYGFDDEDVIDLDEPTMLIQPASVNHIPLDNDFDHDDQYDQYDQASQLNQDQQYLVPHVQQQQQQQQQQPDPAASDARIEELQRRLDSAERALEDAKAASLKKAGEIAIIRAGSDKRVKELERTLAVQQKLHADDVAKHRAEAEAARKTRETLETNSRFLEHDLAEVTERTKRLKATTRSPAQSITKTSTHTGPSTAPFDIPFRDGFDDHEITTVSPSKVKERPKAETPKAGEKRKRKVDASPLPLLRLETVASTTSPSVGAVDAAVLESTASTTQPSIDEVCLQTIQRILNHRPATGRERSLEMLTRLSFPSLSGKSIAGLVVDMLTRYIPTKDKNDLPLYVCNAILDLWSRCLQDRYYAPLHALADLLEFVLATSPRYISTDLIDTFVPLATKSIDLIAVPLARPMASTSEPTESKPITRNAPALLDDINVDHVLSIMHKMAMTASLSIESNRKFWKKMEFDFVLMMLNVPQQLHHMQLVLQMVGVSVLTESFGVISPQPEKQSKLETHAIDRLTNLLFEQPKAPSDEPPYEDEELASLRIEVIRTLGAISVTKHGSRALAQHKTAIGRLLRFMHIQVTALYDLPPSWLDGYVSEGTARPESIHNLTTMVINLTMRLLYDLLQHHTDLINLREKLAVIPGGHHKFLVSLTRLAFSDQLVYEAGIDEETVDAAHEILDRVLSTEEGEAVFEAIETPRGSNMTRASIPG